MIGGLLSSFERNGFAVLTSVFTSIELGAIRECVGSVTASTKGLMRSQDVYAVRQAFQAMPGLLEPVLNDAVRSLVRSVLGTDAFITKSIWFEKPPGGNWFVGWHQDISISAKERIDVPGYSRWTAKHGMVGVVPPIGILERTLTVRIHVDDADAENGAVRVIPGSHLSGIQPPPAHGTEGAICAVPAGGVMLMRPLLLHASSRSRSERPRRVLHLEFNDRELDAGLEWAERIPMQ
jgi:Phytanoyl-CoA dioxygenase (PhyH)